MVQGVRRWPWALVAAWCSFGGNAPADDTLLNEFEWRCRIQGELQAGTLHKFPLSTDIVARLKSFPLDIKVVAHDDAIWPCMVWSEPGGEETFVVFTPGHNGSAHLYFGSSRYRLPPAGFISGVNGDKVGDAREVALAGIHPNPTRVVESLDDYWRSIVNLLIFIVAATLLVLTMRVIKMRYYS
jgi:hypothetical protein